MAKILIRSLTGATFFRAGLGFPPEGRVIETDELSAEALALLGAEPNLRAEPAPTDADVEAVQAADLSERIRRAIAGLTEADFEDGKPKLAAVKAALPEDARRVTAKLLSEIWAGLQPPPAA